MNSVKKMIKYGNFQKRIIFAFSEYFLSCVCWLIINQYLTYSIFDDAISKNSIKILVFLTILVIIKQIFSTSEGIFHCIIRHHLQRDYSNFARKDLFAKCVNAKTDYFDKESAGNILELIMNDTTSAATFFTQNGLITFGNLFAKIPLLLIILLLLNSKLAIILILIYCLGYSSLIISNKKTFKLILNIRKYNILLNKWTTEQINNFELIKSLGIEKKRLEKITSIIDEYNLENEKLDRIIRKYNFSYNFFSLITTVITTCIGGIDLYQGILTYGTLMLFINGTSSIKGYCDELLYHLPPLNKAFISLKKIYSFSKEYIPEYSNGNVEVKCINKIEFKNVHFSYENKKVLNNINITANSNNKIALVGKTGSGKTTLINLLCKFYDIDSGEILINEKSIDLYSLNSLRNNIGYVMQDIVIYDGNIYDNINFANKNVTTEDIISICKKLKLHDKIMTLKDGYNTNLSKNQDIFSVGEKQMINFARIMVEKPSVIILDEVTSSLSYENEELIKNAIEEITKDKICFIVAHRLSTIKSCNKIIYLEDGKIVEQGTHEQLLKNKSKYFQLLNSNK